MKKESAAGIFFSMFLKAIVVILGIVIVLFGIVIATKIVKGDKGTKNKPSTTVGENVLTEQEEKDHLITNETTAAPYKEDEADDSSVDKSELKILVLNSTDISGLAGRWSDKISEMGYGQVDASDYAETIENTKIVSTKEGLGKELIQCFKNASYEVGTVTENVSESTDGYDIVIIIGSADDDGQSVDSDDSGDSDESYDSDEEESEE